MFKRKKNNPTLKLTVVVTIYNMQREAPRTLRSLSASYQQGVDESDYEVIVVDNGSDPALNVKDINAIGNNFHYHYINNASPSPAAAMNLGIKEARGEYICLMIDGARIVTPRIIHFALKAFAAFKNPVLTAPAWHLGPDIHREAVKKHGYSKAREDELLEQISWPADGYRLYEIATLAGSSQFGWFMPMAESSTLFLRTDTCRQLGGYDEQFDQPGGGLVNFDIYIRACELPDADLVMLLGEGSFHQMHGGAMTGTDEEKSKRNRQAWVKQYEDLRQKKLAKPAKEPHYLGQVPRQALPSIADSARIAIDAD